MSPCKFVVFEKADLLDIIVPPDVKNSIAQEDVLRIPANDVNLHNLLN